LPFTDVTRIGQELQKAAKAGNPKNLAPGNAEIFMTLLDREGSAEAPDGVRRSRGRGKLKEEAGEIRDILAAG
jgi:hypothetical protein